MISISLFCFCKIGFTLFNILMIEKNLMKLHYLKTKIFTVALTWKILLMQITCTKKRVCKDFLKKLEEYNDLYIQNNTLLLAKVFENFQNMYL